MRRQVVWDTAALDAAAGILKHDPAGLAQLMDALDRLAEDPRPAESMEFASADVRRLFVGLYRALYEITNGTIVVIAIHRVS